MSSTIKLYEHNQKAYDALLDMLGERDRACVIKPTGTGKFVIIAKCAAQGLWCSLHGLAVADGSCEWVEISAC